MTTNQISFKMRVEKGNRITLPKNIRNKFQLMAGQTIKVNITALSLWGDESQTFYANITKDGRIAIPKLLNTLMTKNKTNLAGQIIEITLQPN